MPRLPRISGNEAVSVLERLGFFQARQTGSIEKALQLGIRYFHTASSYGPSEDYLGKVLPPARSKLFLASKTDKRDRDGAWRELERSLYI